MSYGEYYAKSIENDKKQQSAKKLARSEIFNYFFVYITSFALCMLFCGSLFLVLRYGVFLAKLFGFDIRFLLYTVWLFLSLPVISGCFGFCFEFSVTHSRKSIKMFSCFSSFEEFAKSAKLSLYIIVSFCVCLFPFILFAALPYKLDFDEKGILIFEVLSLFLLICGVFCWLSLIAEGRITRKTVYFFLSFIFHLILVYFSRGAWLLWLLPYGGISYKFFISCKEETST